MKILKTDAYSRKANAFRRDVNFAASEAATGGGALKADDFAKSPRTEAGFTLAEIMVGTALLAVMVVSLYGGISFGFTNITLARQNLRATQIALEKMEI